MTTEEIEKLDKRAKRFNTKNPLQATEVGINIEQNKNKNR